MNVTGWWAILSIIPIISIPVSLALFFVKGTPGVNQYGEDPKSPFPIEKSTIATRSVQPQSFSNEKKNQQHFQVNKSEGMSSSVNFPNNNPFLSRR